MAMVLSLVGHVALLSVLLFGGNSQPKPKEPEKVITTVLVRKGDNERPKHLLPRKVTAPPPAPAPVNPTKKAAPVVKEEKAAPKKEAPSNTKVTQERLQQLAKMQKKLLDARKEENDEGEPDGDEEGTVSDVVQARVGNLYMSTVKNTVMPNFVMPNVLSPDVCANLPQAMVVIRVANDGVIISNNLEKSSGNHYFDNALLQAIKRTGRVPPPPPVIAERVRNDGIEMYALCSSSM